MDHREVVLCVQPDLIDHHGPFGVVWMHVHDFTDNAVGRGEEAERASTVDIVGENRLQSRRAAWPDSNRATRLIHAQQREIRIRAVVVAYIAQPAILHGSMR